MTIEWLVLILEHPDKEMGAIDPRLMKYYSFLYLSLNLGGIWKLDIMLYLTNYHERLFQDFNYLYLN